MPRAKPETVAGCNGVGNVIKTASSSPGSRFSFGGRGTPHVILYEYQNMGVTGKAIRKCMKIKGEYRRMAPVLSRVVSIRGLVDECHGTW